MASIAERLASIAGNLPLTEAEKAARIQNRLAQISGAPAIAPAIEPISTAASGIRGGLNAAIPSPSIGQMAGEVADVVKPISQVAGNAARGALDLAGQLYVPLTLADTAITAFNTPTEQYDKRFGFGPSSDGLLGIAQNTGKRTLGVASDLGNAMTLGAAGLLYRDKQEQPSIAAAPVTPQQPAANPASTPRDSAIQTSASQPVTQQPALTPVIQAQPKRKQPGNMQPSIAATPSTPTSTGEQGFTPEQLAGNVPYMTAQGSDGSMQAYYMDPNGTGKKVTYDPQTDEGSIYDKLPGLKDFNTAHERLNSTIDPNWRVNVSRGGTQTIATPSGEIDNPSAPGGVAANRARQLTEDRMSTLTAPFRNNRGEIDPELLKAGSAVISDATEPIRQTGETERNKATIASGITREAMQQGGLNSREDPSAKAISKIKVDIMAKVRAGTATPEEKALVGIGADKVDRLPDLVKLYSAMASDLNSTPEEKDAVKALIMEKNGLIKGQPDARTQAQSDARAAVATGKISKSEANKRLQAAGMPPI